MAEPAGFAAFVGARGDALHHTAYLMTGDHAAAEQLLVTALVAAWPRWSRLAGDPEPFLRRALAERVAPRWQRGTSREPIAALAVGDELLPEWPEPLLDPHDDAEQRAADRVTAVTRRVAARRRTRQRIGIGALTVVLVGAVIGGAKALQPQPHRAAPRAETTARVVTPPAAAVIPTYYNGGRLLNSTKVDLSRVGSTAFTVIPTRFGLDFAFRCPVQMSGTGRFEIRVGGSLVLETGCVGSDPSGGIGGPQVLSVDGSMEYGGSDPTAADLLKHLGVRLGRPTTVLVTVTAPAFAVTPPPLVIVGVYQDVPFTDYPKPARPTRVPPPTDIGPAIGHPQQVVTPGGAANGTWTARVPYRSDLVVNGAISAPGQVRVRLNGQPVGGLDSWDYEGASLEVPLGPTLPPGVRVPRPGQLVTVTVTLSGFTAHDWKILLGRAS